MRTLQNWLRVRLFLRGWVRCDYRHCHKVIRPRWLAMRQGWHCAGIAGAYDTCPEHRDAVWDRYLPPPVVDDGFGSVWVGCSDAHCDIQIVRPGKVQCSNYCGRET